VSLTAARWRPSNRSAAGHLSSRRNNRRDRRMARGRPATAYRADRCGNRNVGGAADVSPLHVTISGVHSRWLRTVHNKRNDHPPRNHRVILLSTAIVRNLHFTSTSAVVTFFPRMRGTSHPETGPKRPSNPPGPARPGSPRATAAEG
jgi:hypothetical protein